ncbi:MAG TPA: murein biosynthesis integral membrane protein MurJ, partial [Methylomirabilota bacterium]|nr:murein biosynthesis integral membrane protein MurJ [Methylomirabilota bacterium]
MSQMLKSSGAMAAATMLSRVLGLVREIAYAGFMGDSAVASAFKFAFVVPNLFRRLLGEGALTAAFIPIFKEKEKTAGEAEMWRAANAVISAVVIVSAGIIALVLLGVSLVLAWGALEANTRLMLELLRVMLPYLLLVCLAAIFMGMLNARGYFFIPALGATMLNVVMIASVYLAAPRFGATKETQIFALACGVVVAGIAQAVFQLPSLHREGFRLAWVRPWPDDTVRQVVRKMIPAALGVAAYQINIMITFALGFRVDETVVASFDYAVRLMELPQGVFGVSLATYLLPTLSGLAVERKYPEFRATLARGVSYLAFVNALAAALLVALAEPMIRLLFERGAFDVLSTKRATLALQCLAPGLLGFSLVNVLARAFFALGDTQTPMRISVFCLGFNVLLAFLFVEPLRQGGLALANTLSSVVNVLLLLHALRRKLGRLEFADVRKHLPLLFACAVLAGWIGWGLARWWSAAW